MFSWSEASPDWISRRVGKKIRRQAVQILQKMIRGSSPYPHPRSAGTPPGLGIEEVAELTRTKFGTDLVNVSNEQISGWKKSGAFRLYLEVRDGLERTVIFKNEIYERNENPALDGFPMRPGPPEYEIYRSSISPLSGYLPTVFLSEETVPSVKYRYILEDLKGNFFQTTRKNVFDVVTALPGLHEVLRTLPESLLESPRLIHYPERRNELLEYFQERLSAYASESSDSAVSEIMRRWPQIEDVYLGMADFDERLAGVVHGDPNLTNVHLSSTDRTKIKFVDWEWAGLHLVHADLASVLKGRLPRTEKIGINLFAQAYPSIPLREHYRTYNWCKMERGLIDSSFVSSLLSKAAGHAVRFDAAEFVTGSARRVLHALQQLSNPINE